MARDRYLDALCQIEKSQKDQLSVFRNQKDRFTVFVQGLYGERLTENEYLKLLELFYRRAQQEEARTMKPGSRRRARLYCLLQMKRLEKSRKQKKLRRFYPFLDPSPEPLPELEDFVHQQEDFYSGAETRIVNRALWSSFVSVSLLLMFLVLVLHLPFFPTLAAVVILWAGFLIYTVRILAPRMADHRIRQMTESLEPLHRGLEEHLPGRPDASVF